MTDKIPQQMLQMLIPVAEALGDEMLSQVAFVGGSTTALLISDPITRHAVRFTEDVDLIVNVNGRADWHRMQQHLRTHGFREDLQDELSCRMRLGQLKVDFMPDDEAILGFTNRWYRLALATARPYTLTSAISIRLLTPTYFIATKLEAYRGRANNDPLTSHDLEDIINLVDGREELLDELSRQQDDVRHYIATQFSALLDHPDFDYAVQGNLQDNARSELFFSRWQQICAMQA